jgi:hypothetical protein
MNVVSQAHAASLADLSQNVIYLMGISFVLGSLFTIFVLLLLDFMRRNNKPGA